MKRMKNKYKRFTFKRRILMSAAALFILTAAALAFVLVHFRVTEVEVIGNHHYTEDEIKAMILKDSFMDNSLLLDLKYRSKSIDDIPFIESMDVEVLGADSIRIMVYEKTLAGCVTYLGDYMYFDREGIVVESASEATDGVPEITGLNFGSVQLYKKLPQGYDTVIGEDGGSLSQGQKQLLCIARVMLCLPPMLILDEATSSIDTRTEIRIQKAFAAMMEGRTSFIVAHRLSTIREADVILVMKDGNIIEQGDHETLLKQNGFYATLYNSQFVGYSA